MPANDHHQVPRVGRARHQMLLRATPPEAPGPEHSHRDVQGGQARATIFGVSDGLVSNVSLILGVAGANPAPAVVRLAGVAGLLAGAASMAAGEYVSVRAQTELLEHELAIERRELANNPNVEQAELAQRYESRGITPEVARSMAHEVMADLDVALEVHAREELGIDPSALGSPIGAAVSSFGAFCVGAMIPLVPWFFADGAVAVWTSLGLALFAAACVGAILARMTARNPLWPALRQVLIAAAAAGVTYLVGSLFGVGVT